MDVTLTTITPVHIGSGQFFLGNADYVYFGDRNQIALIDDRKVLDIIGQDHIHQWLDYIDGRVNQSTFLEYLNKRKSGLMPDDIGRRIITYKGSRKINASNTLKEQIHGGFNKPYIPGSSLKGSIRTAIFSDKLFQKYRGSGVPKNMLCPDERRPNIVKDNNITREVFGINSNADWLRMLHVGDFYFNCQTEARFAEVLNLVNSRDRRYSLKDEVKQLVEYIPANREAVGRINIAQIHLNLISKKNPNLFNTNVTSLKSETLITLLKDHTLDLLDNEISHFEDSSLPDSESDFLENMELIKDQVNRCADNECIVRLGYGTGYLNMTGDWVDELVRDADVYNKIKEKVRHRRYRDFELPKSRKIISNGTLLGYVKLKFNN